MLFRPSLTLASEGRNSVRAEAALPVQPNTLLAALAGGLGRLGGAVAKAR